MWKTFAFEYRCEKCGKTGTNDQPQISPWIFAPLPKEGEEQELVVSATGRGRFFIFVDQEVIFSGYNGGKPRTEARYWKDGKLVYEREE